MEYKFNFEGKEYNLGRENLEDFFNDEVNEVEGFDIEEVVRLLNGNEEVSFSREYFGSYCSKCEHNKGESKVFSYLEYYFYIYTKDNKYVISDISKEYEDTNYNKLLKEGKVDNCYIVRIIVCENCGEYTVEIEEFDM